MAAARRSGAAPAVPDRCAGPSCYTRVALSDPSPRLLQLCHELVESTEPPGRLLALGGRAAAIGMPDRSVVDAVAADVGAAQLGEHFARVVADNPHHHLKLVLIGGGNAERESLRRARPRLALRRAVQTYHLADDGELWVGPGTRADSPVGRALARVGRGEGPIPDREALMRQIDARAPSPEEAATWKERKAFVERTRATRLVATPVLLAVLALVYALQWWWGGGTTPAVLVRMGANTPEALHGQPERLLASVFLHGGLLHLAVNGWVAWVLGGFMERLLGPARLCALWVLAGAAGALASVVVGHAELSVGASGALWGTLAAAGVLAFRPEGILPASVVPAIRRAAIINLAIAGSASLLPRVDLWAHLGGGLAGVAFVLALRHRLARASSAERGPPPASGAMRTFAAALVIAAFTSLALSIVQGRPWSLREPAVLQERALAPGVELMLPAGLGEPRRIEEGGTTVLVFGDLKRDPIVAVASLTPHDLGEAARAAEVRAAATKLPVPSGVAATEPWHDVAGAAHPSLEAGWEAPEVYGRGAWQLREHVLVELEVWWSKDAPDAAEDAAARVFDSLVRP